MTFSCEFEPTGQSIRNWIAGADKKEGRQADTPPGLSAVEGGEMARLRRDNKQLRVERDILLKTSAWFARQTGPLPSGSVHEREPGMLPYCHHGARAWRLQGGRLRLRQFTGRNEGEPLAKLALEGTGSACLPFGFCKKIRYRADEASTYLDAVHGVGVAPRTLDKLRSIGGSTRSGRRRTPLQAMDSPALTSASILLSHVSSRSGMCRGLR